MKEEPVPGLQDLPREIAPQRDLWPGIRTRLAAAQAPKPRPFLLRRPKLAVAAALFLFALVWVGRHATHYAWRVEYPLLEGQVAAAGERFETGTRVATGDGERALIVLPGLGQIELQEHTALALEHVGFREQRARLERGSLAVEVAAPPRLLVLTTAHAQVVDLGCAYRLRCGPAGTRVDVTSGAVLVVAGKTQVVVPEGRACEVDAAGRVADVGTFEGQSGSAPAPTPAWRQAWRWAWSFFVGGPR